MSPFNTVLIEKHTVKHLDPVGELFNIVVTTETGEWRETYGDESQVDVFLRGLKAMASLTGRYFGEENIRRRDAA